MDNKEKLGMKNRKNSTAGKLAYSLLLPQKLLLKTNVDFFKASTVSYSVHSSGTNLGTADMGDHEGLAKNSH